MLIDALPCPRCGGLPQYKEDGPMLDMAVCSTEDCEFRSPVYYVSEWDWCVDGWNRNVLTELREDGE